MSTTMTTTKAKTTTTSSPHGFRQHAEVRRQHHVTTFTRFGGVWRHRHRRMTKILQRPRKSPASARSDTSFGGVLGAQEDPTSMASSRHALHRHERVWQKAENAAGLRCTPHHIKSTYATADQDFRHKRSCTSASFLQSEMRRNPNPTWC